MFSSLEYQNLFDHIQIVFEPFVTKVQWYMASKSYDSTPKQVQQGIKTKNLKVEVSVNS